MTSSREGGWSLYDIVTYKTKGIATNLHSSITEGEATQKTPKFV